MYPMKDQIEMCRNLTGSETNHYTISIQIRYFQYVTIYGLEATSEDDMGSGEDKTTQILFQCPRTLKTSGTSCAQIYEHDTRIHDTQIHKQEITTRIHEQFGEKSQFN